MGVRFSAGNALGITWLYAFVQETTRVYAFVQGPR